ncbi:MAG TPA: acyl-CoA synthetase [Acidimicrobiia bacterium]|nr:acyl-CoA synthetase [Acidimicrobiia bacterium]
MAFNIADMIEYCVDAVPEREAVVDPRLRVTYAQLDERANRLAHHLAAQGVGAGQHVGIYAYNRVEFVETQLAALKLRAVPININYRYVPAELRYIFENADLVALVFERQFAPLAAEAGAGVETLRHFVVLEDGSEESVDALAALEYEKALEASSPERGFEARTDDDHYVIYTGGTTGMPKGVVWRHEDVFRTLGGGIDFYTREPVASDREMAERAAAAEHPLIRFPIPPLMHGAAQWATFQGLFLGEPVVLIPRFDPADVWATVARERVNLLLVTGDAMARPLADSLRDGGPDGPWDTSSLVSFSSSAAVFTQPVKDEIIDLLGPNVILTDSIGSSETGFGGLTMVQRGQPMKGGPTVSAGADTIVIDDDNRPIAAGAGVVGRIARGGNVPVGYYNDPVKTAETFIEIDGRRFAVPGDYGIVEDDGSITLLGRGSMCINSGGEKIYPEEVEGALKSHPAVFDALVVGVPDERFGERVAAVVAPRSGAAPTLEELDAHCRQHVAGYKVPRELHLVAEVGRLPSGKPDYPWAKKVALGEIAG